MKNDGTRCPGCGKHCKLGQAGCGYGVKYFAKQNANNTTAAKKDDRYEWERFVEKGGLMWRLLTLGRNTKRALKKKTATEAQLMGALTAEEKEQLSDILKKLESENAAVQV